MRLMYVIFIAMVCCSIIACSSVNTTSAGPLISKPEFRGRVIDAETKEPLEGAVVVVMYRKSPIISGPAGGSTSTFKVKETLTDSKGEFLFPAYSRLLSPLSDDGGAEFIIYKPGYGDYPGMQVSPPSVVAPGYFFSKNFGLSDEVKIKKIDKSIITITYRNGIVELPKLKTKEERLRASPAVPSGFGSKELPLLYKTINEENKRYGLGEAY